LAANVRDGKRRAPARLLRRFHGRARAPIARSPRAGRTLGTRRRAPEPALGRPAAARGDRASNRERARGSTGGRAHRQSRLQDRRGDHGADRPAPRRTRDHRRDGDTRSDVGCLGAASGLVQGRTDLRRLKARRVSPATTTRLALSALLRNKMRSLLTTLGIVIGVAAVLTMQSMGSGATAYVGEAISGLGSNMLIAMPGATKNFGPIAIGVPLFTMTDIDVIRRQAHDIAIVAPVNSRVLRVVAGGNNR